MDLAIGVIVFWTALAAFFGVRAICEVLNEERRRAFLQGWDDA